MHVVVQPLAVLEERGAEGALVRTRQVAVVRVNVGTQPGESS